VTTAPIAAAPAAASHAAATGHENLNAVLWVQTATEYEASARQAYAAARTALSHALETPSWSAAIEQQGGGAGLPPAVVLDLDETVLDNGVFQARLIETGAAYSESSWREWVEERQATAVPGALAFVRDAESRGVTVFYVTNREAGSEPATRENLERLGFALGPAGRDTVLCRGERPEWTGSDKSSRRINLAREYRILLLVGDDLGDFLPHARGMPEQRRERAAPYAHWWGTRWIVVPNPMYGSWERAVTDEATGAPSDPAQRKRARLRLQ
jgi:acid phosphatase